MSKQCIYLIAERHISGMYLNGCDKLKENYPGISYCKICRQKQTEEGTKNENISA
jgi:hypothetical protein